MKNSWMVLPVGIASLTFVACGSSAENTGVQSGAGGQSNTDGGPSIGVGGTGMTGSAGSTGTAGSTSGPAVLDAEAFCRTVISEAGIVAARCVGGSQQTWSQLFRSDLECGHVREASTGGRVAFSLDNAAACLELVRSVESAACDSSTISSTPSPSVQCSAAIKGTVAIGGACKSFHVVQFFQECAGSAFCDQGGASSCVGTCKAYVDEGGACDSLSSLRCAPGFSCVNKSCVANGKLNAACGGASGAQCANGFYCAGSTAQQGGTCQDRKQSGPCASAGECASGSTCDKAGQCTPHKAVGEVCVAGNKECGILSYCDAGKCAAKLPGAGQPCGTVTGESVLCGEGYCDAAIDAAGSCRAQKKPGEDCTTYLGECGGDGGHCDATTHKCVSCDAM